MVREKEKFLVRQRGYISKEDTWKCKENLENVKELIKEFERKYGEEAKELRQQEQEEEKKKFSQESSKEFTAKLLYGQDIKTLNLKCIICRIVQGISMGKTGIPQTN